MGRRPLDPFIEYRNCREASRTESIERELDNKKDESKVNLWCLDCVCVIHCIAGLSDKFCSGISIIEPNRCVSSYITR